MKNVKRFLVLFCSLILSLGMIGCTKDKNIEPNNEVKGEVSKSEDSHYPVTITTYNYQKEPVEVTFNKAPEKVVAIYQNSIEIMLALGLEDKIVACAGLDHKVDEQYEEAFNKLNYLEDFTPSKESIIMQKPDFILGWVSLFDEKRLGDVDYWHKNNTNTYISLNSGIKENRTIENEIEDILNLGKIFNVEDKAQQIVDEINKKIESVSKDMKHENKQSTLILEFMDEQIYTYGETSLGGDMVNKLGAKLLNPSGGNIGKEDLIKLNPESIFVVYMDRGEESIKEKEINKILKNKAFSSLDAVKNNRVYAIPLGEMYSSGIRTINGINTFSEGLYQDINN